MPHTETDVEIARNTGRVRWHQAAFADGIPARFPRNSQLFVRLRLCLNVSFPFAPLLLRQLSFGLAEVPSFG